MRLLVAVLVVVATAGCLGTPPAETSTDAPTATPFPDRVTGLPDGPKERPDQPEPLNASTVGEYVRTYEYRYAYNSLWYSEYSDVELECEIDALDERASGYAVTVSCTGYSNTGGPTQNNETATEVHADWFTQTFVYLVDENSTIRTDPDRSTDSETPVPTG